MVRINWSISKLYLKFTELNSQFKIWRIYVHKRRFFAEMFADCVEM